MKITIDEIARTVAEDSELNYDSLPYHRQLTLRAKARFIVRIVKKLIKNKVVKNGN